MGTRGGRSRQATTVPSVTKAWHSRKAGRLRLWAWSKRTAAPGALGDARGASVSSMMAKHRPPWLSRRTMPHSAATKPSSRNRPRSSIQWYACQPRRGVRARNACVTCPPPASSPPTMSSATVRRAGCGMDSTISPTHLPSVAGRPASGRGSMISAGVWCNTRNMGAGRPVAPPHPFQTALTPPGLETPVTVDKNAAYPAAVTAMKREGELWRFSRLRQVKYLNNIVEQDHRRIKRLVRPGLGFGSLPTARRTLAGYEAMAMIRKGQVRNMGGGDMRASVTGLVVSIPRERDPAAGVLLLSAVGAWPLPGRVG